jgi:Ca-activated chloride channel family protein
MKFHRTSLVPGAIALLLSGAWAQNSGDTDNLPAAPSAVHAQKPAAPRRPTPPAAQPSTQPSTASPASDQASPAAPQPASRTSPNGTDATPASALNQSPSQEDITTTFRRTVNEVNVVFTVTDKHGHYIKDMKANDFQIVDDKKPPAQLRSFHSETDLPLRVGLLVDASNSVRDRFKFEQESAIEFLNQTVRPRYDRAFVVGFDVTPEVTQDFTDNTEALSQGVRSLRPGGGTAMYDALYFACRDKLLKEQQTGPERKAIILLSDGDDNQSHVTREEAIDMAQRASVIVYTISTNVTGSRQSGDKILERIADATGGHAFFPFQITDVSSAFSEIQDELRSQYLIAYTPADFRPDGRYRTIEILAKNHKGLRVRSRPGYYAPAQ